MQVQMVQVSPGCVTKITAATDIDIGELWMGLRHDIDVSGPILCLPNVPEARAFLVRTLVRVSRHQRSGDGSGGSLLAVTRGPVTCLFRSKLGVKGITCSPCRQLLYVFMRTVLTVAKCREYQDRVELYSHIPSLARLRLRTIAPWQPSQELCRSNQRAATILRVQRP
jgi:hypothetical protein